MPALRQRERALRAEIQAIADQTQDRDMFLRLAETRSSGGVGGGGREAFSYPD